MNKHIGMLAFQLFSLCAYRGTCQSIRKIDYQALSCPSREQVIDDIDLNGDGTCERIRIMQSLPNTINSSQYQKEFWEEDCYKITIEDFAQPLIYTSEFCTSYGEFTIYIVNLTGNRNLDLVFELYKNRGTSVTEKYFIVKHWDGHRLVEKAIFPGSMYIGQTPYDRAAYCERTLTLRKQTDKQYEAFLHLECEAMSGVGSLADAKPVNKAEREFVSQEKLRLVYSKQSGRFHLASGP